MSYIYGRKIAEKMGPLIEQLRLELFVQPYDKINWSAAKDNVCEADIYFPRSPILHVTNSELCFFFSLLVIGDHKKTNVIELFLSIKRLQIFGINSKIYCVFVMSQ